MYFSYINFMKKKILEIKSTVSCITILLLLRRVIDLLLLSLHCISLVLLRGSLQILHFHPRHYRSSALICRNHTLTSLRLFIPTFLFFIFVLLLLSESKQSQFDSEWLSLIRFLVRCLWMHVISTSCSNFPLFSNEYLEAALHWTLCLALASR